MTMTEVLMVSFINGLCWTGLTVVALKTDIGWLKRTVNRAHLRIDKIQEILQTRQL